MQINNYHLNRVKDLETKIERLEQEIKEHNSHSQIFEDRFFHVQFRISLDDLNRYIDSSFSKNNEVDNVLFAATVDVINRKLVDIRIG